MYQLRFFDPRVDVLRHHSWQVGGQAQGFGLRAGHASNGIERQLFHPHIVFGGNFLRNDQVKPGLRLTRVSDGGRADFKISFGRGQLLRYSRFLGLYKRQGVLRRQRVEVGLAGAYQQVLLGGVKHRFGRINLLEALLISSPVRGPIERLIGI